MRPRPAPRLAHRSQRRPSRWWWSGTRPVHSSTSLARRPAGSSPGRRPAGAGCEWFVACRPDGQSTRSNVTRAPWPSYLSGTWARRWLRRGWPASTRSGTGGTPCDLVVVGDVMLTRGVPDPAAALAPMSPLPAQGRPHGRQPGEHPLHPRHPDAGERLLRGWARADPGPLRRAGFDAVSLANNHAGDYGEAALLDSVGALAGQPDRAVRCRREHCRGFPAGGHRARWRAVRLRRVQRDRRDTEGGPGHPRGVQPPDAAEDRTTGAGGPGPGAARRTTDRPAGRRRRGAPALGDAVHPSARAGPAPRRLATWSVPGPTWSWAVTRTGCREWTRSATCRCCTHSGTSSSTWTSWSRRWRGSSWRRRSGARSSGQSGCCRTGWTTGSFAPRRVAGAAAARILDDVWSTSTGPFAAR